MAGKFFVVCASAMVACLSSVTLAEPDQEAFEATVAPDSDNAAGRLVWLMQDREPYREALIGVATIDLTSLSAWSSSEAIHSDLTPSDVSYALGRVRDRIDLIARAALLETFDVGNELDWDDEWASRAQHPDDPRWNLPAYARSASRLLLGDAVWCWTHGERERAIARVDASFALCEHLAQEDLDLVYGLTCCVIAELSLDLVEALAGQDLSEEERAALVASMGRLDPADPAGMVRQWRTGKPDIQAINERLMTEYREVLERLCG